MEFYYAKLNISGNMGQDFADKKDVVIQGLLASQEVTYRNQHFRSTEEQTISANGREYFTGIVIKYNNVTNKQYQLDADKAVPIEIRDQILAEVIYVIDFKENIVLYTEVKRHINKASFLARFTDILYSGIHQIAFADVALYPITEEYAFYQALQSFRKVHRIYLKLHPTNPSDDEIIRAMDQKLKRQNLKTKTEIYQGNEGGINIEDDEIVVGSRIVDLGYAKGNATGELNDGKTKTIYSEKSAKQKKTPSFELDERGLGGILEDLDKKI